MLVDLRVTAMHMQAECGKDVTGYLTQMDLTTDKLRIYSKHLFNNSEMTTVSVILDNDVDQLLERYAGDKVPSATYCKLKSENFQQKIDRMLEALGETS